MDKNAMADDLTVRPCSSADLSDWLALRRALWPQGADDHADEAAAMLAHPDRFLTLIARLGGRAVGLAEAALRYDYVNGCTTTPVAFLEGVYVAPAWRRRGVARALVAHVAQWGRNAGCAELASDAALDNAASHAMHCKLGFEETERVVYFRQAL